MNSNSRLTKMPRKLSVENNQEPKAAGMQPVRGKERITMRLITIKVDEFGDYQAYYPVGGIELPIGTPFPVRKIAIAREFWSLSGYGVKVESVKLVLN